MAHLNVKERVIETKVVYYGAGLSGKTTNLEQIKRMSVGGRCGDLMSVDTDGDRTLFFDWLPMNIGKFNGCDVKVQLFTVPGQAKYAETRKKVLAGADGVVLVLDSQSGALERNVQVLSDLRDHLRENKLEGLPIVVQLNKRDLPTALPIEELLAYVGVASLPHVPASAATGEGVFETLREMIRHVLVHVREKARDPQEIRAGSESVLDGHTLYGQISDGLANAPALATRGARSDVAADRSSGELPVAGAPAGPAVAPPAAASAPAVAPAAVAPPSAPREQETERGTLVSMEARSFNGSAKVSGGERFTTDVAARTSYAAAAASVLPASTKPEPSRTEARTEARSSSPSLDGRADPQLAEVVAATRQVLRRVDHVEAHVEKAVLSGLVDLERKLAGRLGDGLADRVAERLVERVADRVLERVQETFAPIAAQVAPLGERLSTLDRVFSARLGPLEERLTALDGSISARLAPVAATLAEVHAGQAEEARTRAELLREVARVGTALGALATDVTATKDATGRHVARFAEVATEVAALREAIAGLEDRVREPVAQAVEKVDGIADALSALRVAHDSAREDIAAELRRLDRVDGALTALVAEQQRLSEVTKGAGDAARQTLTELRAGNAKIEESVGKGSATVEALVRAAAETVGAQVEKSHRMQDAASKGTVQRLVELTTAIRDLDGRVSEEVRTLSAQGGELQRVVGGVEGRLGQNFALAVNQVGKLVEGQTQTLQRGTMGLVADVGLTKNVLDDVAARLGALAEGVEPLGRLPDDVRRVGTSVDGSAQRQQALLQETFDQTRARLDVMGERVARITEVMNELSAEMKKPKGWFRG